MAIVHLAVPAGILAALLLWMPDLLAVHLWAFEGAWIVASFLAVASLIGAAMLLTMLLALHALLVMLTWCGCRLPDLDPPFRTHVLDL